MNRFYGAMFYENYINFFKITKAEDGTLQGYWPFLISDNKIGAFPASDTGKHLLPYHIM